MPIWRKPPVSHPRRP
jgi:TorA maturation chaperone TorD